VVHERLGATGLEGLRGLFTDGGLRLD